MKQQTKGGALHRLWQALPWLWMAAAYLFDLWYQLVPGKWIVDSDLASEMILSDLLNKEGSIISHNWFYSTELKVVNLQWFYRLGLLLFPDDWHLRARSAWPSRWHCTRRVCCSLSNAPGSGGPASGWWARCCGRSASTIWSTPSTAGTTSSIPSFICLCWRWCCAASTPTKSTAHCNGSRPASLRPSRA